MTQPLTPPDLDLRDFDWMPLDVARLRDSDLSVLAPGDAFRAAVLLWCASWHQVPAASLPKEDRLLANLAGYGRDLKGWAAVRDDAMRGFTLCSDGRFYHPVVAEKAIEAHGQRNKQRKRTEAATSARRGVKRNDQRNDDRNAITDVSRNDDHLTLPNLTEPKKKGESNPPSKNNLVLIDGNDGPIAIDESYQPSEPAIEYAFSLGMKKAELDDELRKFITKSISLRVVSFNIDMNFKLWCDRWLAWKRKDNPDWKATPEPVSVPQEPFVLVIRGTPEGVAWDHNQSSKGLRPLFYSKHMIEGVEVIAARCKTLIPDGYDEATGEKLAPKSEEDAA